MPGSEKRLQKAGSLTNEPAPQTQRYGNLAALERLQAKARINHFPDNFLRGLFGHLFNVHAPFGTGHEDWPAERPVEQHGHIKFTDDILGGSDEQTVDLFAGLAGLFGD